MIGIVLVSHGELAAGFVDAAAMIMGEQEQLTAVALEDAGNLEDLRAELESAAAAVDDGDGVLVLADLFGGSPANTAAYLVADDVEVVTGLNLPLLLEVLAMRRGQGVTALAQRAVDSGTDGIRRLSEVLDTG